MSDQYRLVFAGEVLEGQHPAVVKKRLATVLKLADERINVLFAGKPVVIKKAVDRQAAARYQSVFKKAGARLRVLPLEQPADRAQAGAQSQSQSPPAQAPRQVDEAGAGDLQVLPVGSDVLKEDERRVVPDADIDTSHLSVQGAVFNVDEPQLEPQGPNVDHITLAEVGAQLGGGDTGEIVVLELNLDFTLAEVGADLGKSDDATPPPPVDLESLNFEVAEPGADMDTREKQPPPPPPDTSHLKVDDQ
jgi:hypothetical protein